MNIVSACVIGMFAGGLGVLFIAYHLLHGAIVNFRSDPEAFEKFCRDNGIDAPRPRRQSGALPPPGDHGHPVPKIACLAPVDSLPCPTCKQTRNAELLAKLYMAHPMRPPKFCTACGRPETRTCENGHELIGPIFPKSVRFCADCGLPQI